MDILIVEVVDCVADEDFSRRFDVALYVTYLPLNVNVITRIKFALVYLSRIQRLKMIVVFRENENLIVFANLTRCRFGMQNSNLTRNIFFFAMKKPNLLPGTQNSTFDKDEANDSSVFINPWIEYMSQKLSIAGNFWRRNSKIQLEETSTIRKNTYDRQLPTRR